MKKDDLKCCGNCWNYCVDQFNRKSCIIDSSIDQAQTCCQYWEWDREMHSERISQNWIIRDEKNPYVRSFMNGYEQAKKNILEKLKNEVFPTRLEKLVEKYE